MLWFGTIRMNGGWFEVVFGWFEVAGNHGLGVFRLLKEKVNGVVVCFGIFIELFYCISLSTTSIYLFMT